MDSNQRDISSWPGSEEPEQVFDVALSLVPTAEVFARKHRLNPETAREAMMEAAKRVVEAQRTLGNKVREPIRNLPAYLFWVGRNLMLAEIRRNKDEVQL